jgi:protein TonB
MLAVPLAATLAIHAMLAAGLEAAERFIRRPVPVEPLQVAFDVRPPPPPPPPAPEPEPAPPPETPPPAPKPVAKPPARRVASLPRAPAPAPGPPDEAPAPQQVYTLPGGDMTVHPGEPGGSPTGVPGGTGKGKGGGAAPESTGTGGPRPVPLASVKVMPEPIGDYDYSNDYPPEARKLGIEGEVLVRILVGTDGRVAETKLARGLGHGLDEKALELARRFRFKPARNDADQPVATWITWHFPFKLPK